MFLKPVQGRAVQPSSRNVPLCPPISIRFLGWLAIENGHNSGVFGDARGGRDRPCGTRERSRHYPKGQFHGERAAEFLCPVLVQAMSQRKGENTSPISVGFCSLGSPWARRRPTLAAALL